MNVRASVTSFRTEAEHLTLIEKLLKEDTDNIFIQLFRYTLVGGTAFIIDLGSLFVFTEYLNIYYLVSAAFAFLLGLTANYILSTVWVFNKRTLSNQWVEFAVFAGIGLIGMGFNELFMWLFTERFESHYLVSKIISTVFVYLWNFSARKLTLFR